MIILIYIIVISLFMGSFLTVCIYRIPQMESIVYGRSHCPKCEQQLKWYDLIPVISYIFLRGQCRYCGKKIAIQYPLIELSNLTAYLWIYRHFGASVESVIYCLLASALIIIIITDIRHMIIPDGLTAFIFLLGLIYTILNYNNWTTYVLGFFITSVPLVLIAIFSKGNMGGGDIKLMAASGLVVGWINSLLALFIGAVLGSVIGLTLIILKNRKKDELIPFAPYLSIGIFIAMLYGTKIVDWYLSIVT